MGPSDFFSQIVRIRDAEAVSVGTEKRPPE